MSEGRNFERYSLVTREAVEEEEEGESAGWDIRPQITRAAPENGLGRGALRRGSERTARWQNVL